jgi:predicted Zn-dependent peptidase
VGYFAVRAGLDKKRLPEALAAIRQELAAVAKRGVTREEFRRAKDNIRGRLVLRFEKPSAYLSFLMSQDLLTNRIMSLEQRLTKLDAVKLTDVNRVARSVIRWNRVSLALIGPYRDGKKFLKSLS